MKLLFIGLVLVSSVLSRASPSSASIEGGDFIARFEGGWLVDWKNKSTGETFAFGLPKLPDGLDYRHYRPGFWSIDPPSAEEESRRQAAVRYGFQTGGADSLVLTESVSGVESRLKALQWGVQIPYTSGLVVHWPRGLAPARMSGADYIESVISPDYYFGNRAAALIGTYKLRSNAYVIQGAKGGLLVYMDNSDLKNFQALEFLPLDSSYKVGDPGVKDHLSQGVIISNRSIQPPTAGNTYNGPRWVIRQFSGGINEGARLYQDFIAKAYHLTPLSERPTAWVQELGLVFVNNSQALRGPRTIKGQRQPAYDYLSEEAWVKGMEDDVSYLERLAKVVEPDKVMFYTTEWATGGHDTAFPEFNPDPYVAAMSRKARAMGFHVMLHMHNSLVHFPTSFTDKYILQTAKYLGLDPAKDHIPGVYYDELRNDYIMQRDKEFGTSWNDRSGQRRVYNAFHMNPANGGWRHLFVNRVVSAILATNADALHLDVPDWMVDRYNDLYGMNPMEGQAELYRLLRQTLDDNGLKHVAISCEVTPNEAFMRYVDLAQRSRNNSARGRIEALASGSALTQEELITLQTGKNLDSILEARKKAGKAATPASELDPTRALALLQKSGKDLGVPSFDGMVFSAFVQCYPHLGASMPDNPAGYLAAWYWPLNDSIPTGPDLSLKEPISPFYYGVLALGRFRVAEEMRLEPPEKWAARDLATYRLKDGRRLHVFRLDDTTQRYAFEDGSVLVDLDIFKGWKNTDVLWKKYGPTSVLLKASP